MHVLCSGPSHATHNLRCLTHNPPPIFYHMLLLHTGCTFCRPVFTANGPLATEPALLRQQQQQQQHNQQPQQHQRAAIKPQELMLEKVWSPLLPAHREGEAQGEEEASSQSHR